MSINYTDPVAVLAWLKEARLKLIAGVGVQSINTQMRNGAQKQITYSKADLVALDAEIARLEAAADTSGTPKRFPIIMGA